MQLKEKVTLNKTESMSRATGIPPHVEQMKLQRELMSLCQTTLERVDNLLDGFVEKINIIFEERAVESGTITSTQLKSMFDNFQDTISKDVQATIRAMKISTHNANNLRNTCEREMNIIPPA